MIITLLDFNGILDSWMRCHAAHHHVSFCMGRSLQHFSLSAAAQAYLCHLVSQFVDDFLLTGDRVPNCGCVPHSCLGLSVHKIFIHHVFAQQSSICGMVDLFENRPIKFIYQCIFIICLDDFYYKFAQNQKKRSFGGKWHWKYIRFKFLSNLDLIWVIWSLGSHLSFL